MSGDASSRGWDPSPSDYASEKILLKVERRLQAEVAAIKTEINSRLEAVVAARFANVATPREQEVRMEIVRLAMSKAPPEWSVRDPFSYADVLTMYVLTGKKPVEPPRPVPMSKLQTLATDIWESAQAAIDEGQMSLVTVARAIQDERNRCAMLTARLFPDPGEGTLELWSSTQALIDDINFGTLP